MHHNKILELVLMSRARSEFKWRHTPFLCVVSVCVARARDGGRAYAPAHTHVFVAHLDIGVKVTRKGYWDTERSPAGRR